MSEVGIAEETGAETKVEEFVDGVGEVEVVFLFNIVGPRFGMGC